MADLPVWPTRSGGGGAPGPTGAQGPAGTQGPSGPAGPEGAPGAPGTAGPAGPGGPAGVAGPAGAQVSIQGSVATAAALPTGLGPADQGKCWFARDTGALYVWDGAGFVNAGNISGPQGPAGPAGPQGATGLRGVQGNTGAQGITGPQGPQGSQGPQGATGTTGAAGNGIIFRGHVATSGDLPNTVAALAPIALGTATNAASSASATYTLTSNVAVGETLLVGLCSANGNHAPASCADSKGNAYVVVGGGQNGTLSVALFYVVVTTPLVAGDTITASFAGGAFSSVKAIGVCKSSQRLVLDRSSPTPGTTGTAYTSAAMSTTIANELLFGVASNGTAAASSTPTNGVTELIDTNHGATIPFVAGYRVLSATGSYVFSGSWASGIQFWSLVGATFYVDAPGLTSNQTGDAYMIDADKSLWVWDGGKWVSGGSLIA